ncbi:unnamed protein product [Symbiodinium sp. KB8]|nr:unnamed protein product [Symbiodinium sp. KB8]
MLWPVLVEAMLVELLHLGPVVLWPVLVEAMQLEELLLLGPVAFWPVLVETMQLLRPVELWHLVPVVLWPVLVEVMLLLEVIHSGVVLDWGNEEGQDTGADDEAEVLFQQLEQLLWARPADPFRALQRLLQQWTGKHDADADYAPSSSWQGGGSSGADAAWWGEDSSTTRWHAVPPASSGRPPAPAADDCGWQTVSRRKPKGRKQGDSAPARVVQLGQGSATAKGSGKGSGKGRDTVKTGNAGTEGTMRAADWCPCASDWDTGAVIVHTIDEVWADPTLDYVVFPRNAGELERFRTFVQSSESAPDITFIVFKGDAELEAGRKEFSEVEWTEARVPGTWRHQLRVASVWLAQCSPEAPALKTTGLQPKAPVVQSTSVLRVHSDWVYCEKGEKAWAEITKNPGSHFRAWAAASFGSIKDTWQWQLTRGPGGAEATVEGLIRMPSARVAAAMSASGSRHGGETWFVSNVSRAQELQGVPALSVHWQDWEPNEAWGTYLARCVLHPRLSSLGLALFVVFGGLVAFRGRGVEEVNEFLLECSFTEPCVEERLPWRGATAWSFRATMPADSDFLSVDLDGDVIEFSRLGRDTRHSRDKALPMEIKQDPPEVQDGMAVDGGGDRQRLDDGKSLAAQGRSRRSATDLRNLCVTHLRKHEATYSAFWRGDAPDEEQGNIKDQGFAEYLRRIGRDKAWGGSIELAALACTLNQPIFVVRPLDGEFDIRVFGPTTSKAIPLSLWFQNRRYQALVGDPEAVAARAVKAEVGDPADRGGLRGGVMLRPLSVDALRLMDLLVLGPLLLRLWLCPKVLATAGAVSCLGGCTASGSGAKTVAASVRASSLGGQTRPSIGQTAAGESGVSGGATRGRENPLAVVQWRYRCNSLAAAGGPDGDPTFRCEHCAFVFQHSSRARVASVRRKHCLQYHEGRGCPGPLKANVEAFRVLTRAEIKEKLWQWKCPLCRFGLPREIEEPVSTHARQRAISTHRVDVHPGVTDAEYHTAAVAQAHCGSAKRRKRGAAAHNRIVSGTLSGGAAVPAEFKVLSWPVVYKCKEHGFRWKLRAAYSCGRCGHLYTKVGKDLSALVNFRCCRRTRARSVKARAAEHKARLRSFKATARALRRRKLGWDADQLEGILREVAAVAATFFATGSQVMALQEVGVNEASVISTVAAFRAHGLRLCLGSSDGSCRRTGLLSTVPGRQVALPSVQHQSRCTAAVFEFSGAAGYTKVLVTSTYGHASDPEAATEHAFDVAAALAATSYSWVMLGDFNVGMDEDPMCRRHSELAAGRFLDDAFIGEVALPMTSPSRLRRIDYGWASFDMHATAVQCFSTVADHLGVAYEFDLSVPVGPVGPRRLQLRSEGLVSDDQWLLAWSPVASEFQEALGVDVSRAWDILSSAAEAALAVDVGVLATCIRRLLHVPGDDALRSNIRADLARLGETFPDLRQYIGTEAAAHTLVQELVSACEAEERAASLQAWRSRLDGDIRHQRDWIRRRVALEQEVQRPCPSAEELQPRTAVHPLRMIEQATAEWLPRWTQRCSADPEAVRNVLQHLPALPQHSVTFDFSGDQLRRIARTMVGKAPGPDGWSVEAWLLLPEGFWSSLAALWCRIAETGEVPSSCRHARVALLPKASGGFRPLSLLAVGWRVGARALLSQLHRWAETFLDHRLLGGVRGRCAKDALSQLLAAAKDGETVVAQDLAKFFDSVGLEHLQAALVRLGASAQLRQLVGSFYATHLRLFSYAGCLGRDWHRTSCGLCQGCPLSPLLAAVVMSGWASHVASSGASALAFVDDRYFFSQQCSVLRHAKRLSDEYDEAFNLSCEAEKCQIAAAAGGRIAPLLSSMWDYKVASSLKVLGVVIDFEDECKASLAQFSVANARRRLRLIAVAAKSLDHRQRLVQQLVSPLYSWAGAFACISATDAESLRTEVLYSGAKGFCVDAARPILLELMGWTKDPVFMRRWCVFQDILRILGELRPWQESAPLSVACRMWHHVLPVATQILEELGWWAEENGRAICRRDSHGVHRRFRVGEDSPRLLMDWLADWHRRGALQSCWPVAFSLHRPGQGLAQGLDLPGVGPQEMCAFEGHRRAYERGDLVTKQLALASGCSAWRRLKKYNLQRPTTCMCGGLEPSRPHIVWTCPSRSSLREPDLVPSNRAEERLFAKTVDEWPAPPVVLDEPGFVEDLTADVDRALRASGDILVATDGSEVLSVAAAAIVVDGQAHSIGVSGEDQTAYKSEVWALVLLFKALLQCSVAGRVTVVSDCLSALALLRGRGQLRVWAHFLVAADVQLRARGLLVVPWWIPSHGKRLPRGWLPPGGWSVQHLREANDIADKAARASASARLSGSLRERCAHQRIDAARWESRVISMAVAIARHFDLHG